MINMSEWLCGDDDVQSKWSDLADEWEEEDAKVLLDMMIELWVTVRGHSTAGLGNDGDSEQRIIAKIKGHQG